MAAQRGGTRVPTGGIVSGNSQPAAFITGVSGQDGLYLAESLLGRGYKVFGTTRDPTSAAPRLPESLRGSVRLLPWDLRDERRLEELVRDCRPCEFYNLGAYASGAGMYDPAIDIGEINGLAVTRILDVIRGVNPQIRLCQASSAEIFGEPSESPQSERTAFRPRSPYGAAKLYAHYMVRIYRQRYGLFACSAILFNHESPRRGLDFVTRKVTQGAASIKLGLAESLALGNLDARRDWGFAGDYVHAMWLMLQAPRPDEYVVASGATHSVRELCELAFERVGLDYRKFVHEADRAAYRPLEPVQLVGDATKLRTQLGWVPQMGFRDLVHMMVDADVEALSDRRNRQR